MSNNSDNPNDWRGVPDSMLELFSAGWDIVHKPAERAVAKALLGIVLMIISIVIMIAITMKWGPSVSMWWNVPIMLFTLLLMILVTLGRPKNYTLVGIGGWIISALNNTDKTQGSVKAIPIFGMGVGLLLLTYVNITVAATFLPLNTQRWMVPPLIIFAIGSAIAGMMVGGGGTYKKASLAINLLLFLSFLVTGLVLWTIPSARALGHDYLECNAAEDCSLLWGDDPYDLPGPQSLTLGEFFIEPTSVDDNQKPIWALAWDKMSQDTCVAIQPKGAMFDEARLTDIDGKVWPLETWNWKGLAIDEAVKVEVTAPRGLYLERRAGSCYGPGDPLEGTQETPVKRGVDLGKIFEACPPSSSGGRSSAGLPRGFFVRGSRPELEPIFVPSCTATDSSWSEPVSIKKGWRYDWDSQMDPYIVQRPVRLSGEQDSPELGGTPGFALGFELCTTKPVSPVIGGIMLQIYAAPSCN